MARFESPDNKIAFHTVSFQDTEKSAEFLLHFNERGRGQN